MSIPTVSETLFEQLCANRGVECERIPEGTNKTADYRVCLESVNLVTEVKQLDPNDEDRKLEPVWGTASSPGAVAPSDRVQGLLGDGYPQIKRSCEGKHPGMIVVYNNSGSWNWIDSFTVVKAMFGSFGIVLGLQSDQTIDVTGHGYLGERKVTKDTFRSLSVVGVLRRGENGGLQLDCHHNPFAAIPVDPAMLSRLATNQYLHRNPHDRGFIPWAPGQLET
jgi:hypothetical protein